MRIDLLKYKRNLPAVQNYLKANPQMSFDDKMTNLSVITYVPLIVIAHYIMKLEGTSEEFEKAVKRLSSFYKYDEVIGLKELMELSDAN